MTLLLTGATGLVGARLLPRLLAAGHACRALVRGEKAIAPGTEIVAGDLFEPASLAAALVDVSAVIHLAAVFRTQDKALMWRSNLDGTRALIAAVKANAPQARFIFVSTSNVYASEQVRPGREDDAVAPSQAYPASKVAAEQALRNSGLTYAIMRFPFVYGDGDGHLAALPGHAAAAGWHPAMRMSTVHHRDIATAMELALAGRFDGHAVNVADDAPASMLDLVTLGGGEMAPSARPLETPWAMQVDTTLARSLSFRPTIRTVFHAAEDRLL